MSAHIYSSFPFLCAHAFLSAKAAADTIASFTLRADWGHLATHHMQEIHFLLSAVLSLSLADSLGRAPFGAQPAAAAVFVRPGGQAHTSRRFVGTVTGNPRRGHIAAVNFPSDIVRNTPQLALVLLVGPSRGILMHNGVLDASYQKVRDDLCRSLQSVTLKDILADYRRLTEE